MTQFYDQNNPVKRRYLRSDSFYSDILKNQGQVYGFTGMENNETSQKKVLKFHNHMAEILSGFTPQDPAFMRMHEEEARLRKLSLYMHMADTNQPKKQLALLINTVKDIKAAIEVCDAYGFGYAPYYPYVMANGKPRGIVIDFSNKDYDNPEFLEAHDYLHLEYLDNAQSHLSSSSRFSLEYARCFWPSFN